MDATGAAYVTGWTTSSEATFPVVGGPALTFNGGDNDAFVAKIVDTSSQTETCDGVDNNGDGLVDEGFPDTDGDGIADCVDNCPAVSNPDQEDTSKNGVGGVCESLPTEICDGLDNDGDGLVDEGFPDTDGDGVADCVDADDDNDGVSDADEVAAGSNPLNAASTPEVCDGVDNDLDQIVDEGFPDTDGDGIADCIDPDDDNDGVADADEVAAGSDPLNAASTPEVCDGLDNDLDQLMDEGFPDTDGDGIADCVDPDDDNDGVADADEVAAGSDPLNAASTPEVCDGLDNDLDQIVDEGFPDTDQHETANCVDTDDDNDGVSDADEVAAGSDPLNPASTPETCDGVDNDLDGLVDEGFPDTDGDGVADCVDQETCDGLDNDGDGLMDDGFPDTDGDGTADCVDASPLGVCNGLAVTIRGTLGGDVLRGTTGLDVINGRDGNDTIHGRGGNDVICGGSGADRLFARGTTPSTERMETTDFTGGPGRMCSMAGSGRTSVMANPA